MQANSPVMAWTSAPAKMSDRELTTGRHKVWTRILRSPTREDASFQAVYIGIFYFKTICKNTEAWFSLCMHLCWTCTAGRPEKRPRECRPGFRQWTFEQQNQHLGSRWEGTTGLWNAQRSFHGTCGWKDLQRKRVEKNKQTGQLLKCSSCCPQNLKWTHAHPMTCLTKTQLLGCRTFAAAYSHDSLKANLPG